MANHSCTRLPDAHSWRFDDIADYEPNRALELEFAGPPGALVEAIVCALDDAVDSRNVRGGLEHAAAQWDDCRAVVQFGIGVQLFDWFFNARSGYRAHFRQNYECGLGFNKEIIDDLRRQLDRRLWGDVDGRNLNSNFEDCGEAQISKEFLMTSLERSDLAKVWFCTKRIQLEGGIQGLPSGTAGEPKILLDAGQTWPSFYRDDNCAWLEIKGAFLGESGPYQVKDPIKRAKELQKTGTI